MVEGGWTEVGDGTGLERATSLKRSEPAVGAKGVRRTYLDVAALARIA